jgi:hypothetical protein
LVGAAGFEPATTRTPSVCATRLRHAPTVILHNHTGSMPVPLSPIIITNASAICSRAASAHNALRLPSRGCPRTPLPVRPEINRKGRRIARLIDQMYQFIANRCGRNKMIRFFFERTPGDPRQSPPPRLHRAPPHALPVHKLVSAGLGQRPLGHLRGIVRGIFRRSPARLRPSTKIILPHRARPSFLPPPHKTARNN